ncbi:MAG: hypothetical protein ACOYMA_03670 [Bacteroidia bacterium]
MKSLIFICLLFILSLNLNAQINSEETEGAVSFNSSQNTYIKFKSTSGISIGDTLYSFNNNQLIPAFIVKNLSSVSVLCAPLSSNKFNINDKIIAKRKTEKKKTAEIKELPRIILSDKKDSSILSGKRKSIIEVGKQKIYGQIGIANYSNFSNTPAISSYVNSYSFLLNINNISDSKFSLESNILFRQQQGEWKNVQKNIFNGLKIYSLSIKYDLKNNSYISFGRKINQNISNIGAIDGFQAEKSFKKLFIGGFVGSRPDYLDYSFNLNLLQYGVYFGHTMQNSTMNMQNSIAVVEQTNHLKTDRRFLYFQHNSSFVKNVSMFYTLELDLYKVLNGQKQNTLSLTSSYLSLRYRPFKKLTLSGTYDSRKNIIYYETDKNYLSTLIESETRQGLSFQGNFTVSQNIYTGARIGYQFQKKDPSPNKNAYLFLSHRNLFKSEIATTLSVTMLESSYLNGNIYNLRFYRGFNSGKINIGMGYSFVNYKVFNSELPLKQHIADVNISFEMIKKILFTLNIETDYESPNQFYRLYLQLRKKF